MAVDVKLVMADSLDPDLNDEYPLKCTDYVIDGDTGLMKFPMTMMKVLSALFKLSIDVYTEAPVILLDFGCTVRTWTLKCYLASKDPTNPIEEVEEQGKELMEFIKNTRFADFCYIQIGTKITEQIQYWGMTSDTQEYTEGKVSKYRIHWNEKQPQQLDVDLTYQEGIDPLDPL
jgi:hypothetical protein